MGDANDSRIGLLQRMPVFGGIKGEIMQSVLRQARMVEVPCDEYFFREDDRSASMFVLESGRVVVLKGWKGRQYRLTELQRGDCFGEMALMDLGPRSASVLAIADCTAIEISMAILHEIYRAEPDQFTMIQMNMGREVSRRLREADRLILEARIEGCAPDLKAER